MDSEPDDEKEEQDPGDEERMKTRMWHVRPEPQVALPSSISQRLRDILAMSRLAGGGRGSSTCEGADGTNSPLDVLVKISMERWC